MDPSCRSFLACYTLRLSTVGREWERTRRDTRDGGERRRNTPRSSHPPAHPPRSAARRRSRRPGHGGRPTVSQNPCAATPPAEISPPACLVVVEAISTGRQQPEGLVAGAATNRRRKQHRKTGRAGLCDTRRLRPFTLLYTDAEPTAYGTPRAKPVSDCLGFPPSICHF